MEDFIFSLNCTMPVFLMMVLAVNFDNCGIEFHTNC